MNLETISILIASLITIILWSIYFVTRKNIILDNSSHKFPSKTKSSTIGWFINSISQLTVLTIFVMVPYLIIMSRPKSNNIVIPDEILSIMLLSILVICAFAIGVHTISVYLFEFIEDKESRLHAQNELFHGAISHIPPFVGVILFTWIYTILEKQHPLYYHISSIERIIIVIAGIISGLNLSMGSYIANVSRAIYIAAFINTVIWFLLLTNRFSVSTGPFTIYTIALSLTVIGLNGIASKQFKRLVNKIYPLPKL